jgi:peroxiredoxin Q/BCP
MIILKEGDNAPEFTTVDQDGKTVSLSGFKGKKVVLYFYPKDDTPGCTAESCNLRDNYNVLQKQGYEVLGVSADNEKSHRKFADKYKLPFRLLADTNKEIINSYGVWGEKKFLGKKYMGIMRTTFIIDEKGIIKEIIKEVKTKKHTEQILGS